MLAGNVPSPSCSFVTSCGGFVAAVDSPLCLVQMLCVWCKLFLVEGLRTDFIMEGAPDI